MQGTRPVDVAFVARRAKTPVRSHGQTAWCPTRLIKKAPMSSRSRSVVVGTARRTPHLWLCAGSSPAPCVAPRSPRLGRCRSSSPATTRCRFPGACTRRNRGRLGKRCRRRMRTALFSPAPPPVARRWHDSPNPSCPAQASWQPRRRSWCLAVTTNRGGYEHTGRARSSAQPFPLGRSDDFKPPETLKFAGNFESARWRTRFGATWAKTRGWAEPCRRELCGSHSLSPGSHAGTIAGKMWARLRPEKVLRPSSSTQSPTDRPYSGVPHGVFLCAYGWRFGDPRRARLSIGVGGCVAAACGRAPDEPHIVFVPCTTANPRPSRRPRWRPDYAVGRHAKEVRGRRVHHHVA